MPGPCLQSFCAAGECDKWELGQCAPPPPSSHQVSQNPRTQTNRQNESAKSPEVGPISGVGGVVGPTWGMEASPPSAADYGAAQTGRRAQEKRHA